MTTSKQNLNMLPKNVMGVIVSHLPLADRRCTYSFYAQPILGSKLALVSHPILELVEDEKIKSLKESVDVWSSFYKEQRQWSELEANILSWHLGPFKSWVYGSYYFHGE